MKTTVQRRKPAPAFDYDEAFQRNLGILSPAEQASLRHRRIAIPGCGGVGSLHAVLLARAGIGKFTLADFDAFEIANFNRQFGAKVSTLGAGKAPSIRNEIVDINPTAEVGVFPEGINPENIGRFLEGVDLVVDSLDFFAFDARRLLFREARNAGIPVVTAAPLGFSSALLVFTPEGMSFDSYFDFAPDDGPGDLALKFAVGLAPRPTHIGYIDPESIELAKQRGPSHAVGVALCGGMAAAAAIKILLGRGTVKAAPHYCQFDAYRQVYRRGWLPWGNRNPWQRLKMWVVRKFIFKVGKGKA